MSCDVESDAEQERDADIDHAIAQEIMGWTFTGDGYTSFVDIPNYRGAWSPTWYGEHMLMVLEEMESRGWVYNVCVVFTGLKQVAFWHPQGNFAASSQGGTLPLAISKAALAAERSMVEFLEQL